MTDSMNNNDGGESLLRKDIIQFVNEHLTEIRQEDDLEKHLKFLFGKYKKFLVEHKDEVNRVFDDWVVAQNNIMDLCEQIKNALHTYLNGDMIDAYGAVSKIMSGDSEIPMQIIGCNVIKNTWYRMRARKPNERMFTSKEMSYPPFNIRNVIDTHRYSILGYPCLYLTSSILCAWCEMDEPAFDSFAVSSVKFENPSKIYLLNLTLPHEEDKRKDDELLMILPLIMACSIKVKHVDKPFKPEYIIPQLVMNAIKEMTEINTTIGNKQLSGCIYTSTKKKSTLETDERSWYNIALPAKVAEDINEQITISAPTCYTYSQLKGNHTEERNLFKKMEKNLESE